MIIYERKGPLKADHVELERKRRVGVGLPSFYCAQREGVVSHSGGEGKKRGGKREGEGKREAAAKAGMAAGRGLPRLGEFLAFPRRNVSNFTFCYLFFVRKRTHILLPLLPPFSLPSCRCPIMIHRKTSPKFRKWDKNYFIFITFAGPSSIACAAATPTPGTPC